MIGLNLNADAAIRMNEQLIYDLRALATRSRRRLAAATKQEHDTHAYHNRSGDAEFSTQTIDNSDADHVDVTVGMGVVYAGALNKRGYSNFVENVEEALKDIERDLNATVGR